MLKRAELANVKMFLHERTKIVQYLQRKRSYSNDFHPRRLYLAINDRCNMACNFCSASSRQSNDLEMSEAVFRQALLGAKEVGVSDIFVTGGEPTQTPELLLKVSAAMSQRRSVKMVLATHGHISAAERTFLFQGLARQGWGGRGRKWLQAIVSYDFDRPVEPTIEFMTDFFRNFEFVQGTIEVTSNLMPEETNARLAELEAAHPDNFNVELWRYPYMIGRARSIRGTRLGEIIRRSKDLINFENYLSIEHRRALAIDIQGLVFPAVAFLAEGCYPVGFLGGCGTELIDVIAEAQWDPIISLVLRGQAAKLYEWAWQHDSKFEGLIDVLADPLEVMVDILQERDKALVIMEEAARFLCS